MSRHFPVSFTIGDSIQMGTEEFAHLQTVYDYETEDDLLVDVTAVTEETAEDSVGKDEMAVAEETAEDRIGKDKMQVEESKE